ncbi:putative tetratricopeptide repeat protein [Gregarina niphandrodes]|uniref:Tetratricopeptide repeat protein n=1 Tax=Gregarina niphandrodes TaxID=110365 RepID=A0A023B3C1_GRENI|nr:putative tetratricopeptide repeat protein [Gregarina niphandrodes]EZG55465.1 putative tetratricopeptide repeat protein [Gregarina niphandrodes]|eukprot:XP_011131546.1 putative tetratricopeptide repeat protein [Gregarina niphandrodes]
MEELGWLVGDEVLRWTDVERTWRSVAGDLSGVSVTATYEILASKLCSYDPPQLLKAAVYGLRLFAQSTWTGPAVANMSCDDLSLLSVDGQVVESLCDCPEALRIGRLLARFLTLEWEQTTDGDMPSCDNGDANDNSKTGSYGYHTFLLWYARSSLMLHRSFVGGVAHDEANTLKREVFFYFGNWCKLYGVLPPDFTYPVEELRYPMSHSPIGRVNDRLNDYILLEISAAMSLYHHGEAFKTFLEGDFWKLRVNFSGRLGIKRQHQQDAVAQLVVEVQGKSSSLRPTLPASTPFEEQLPAVLGEQPQPQPSMVLGEQSPAVIGEAAGKPASSRPDEVASFTMKRTDVGVSVVDLKAIDPHTDVLETPVFTEGGSGVESRSLDEQFYLLSWAAQKLLVSSTSDELAMSEVSALAKSVLEQEGAQDWASWGCALWIRSLAEARRSKWRERACLQMLSLEDQFAKPSPPAEARLRYLWLTAYPNKWEIRRQVGREFESIGAVLTARDMYAKLHMWTDVVECLIAAGRRNEALEVVETELKKQQEVTNTDHAGCGRSSQVLYCLLADIKGEPFGYLRSWELSNGTYARAARSMGRLLMKRIGDLDDGEGGRGAAGACKWLGRSVAVQPYQPATQFTYGCLLMQAERYPEALGAFSQVVSHTEDEYEAWANMGAIHSRLEQWESAKRCLLMAGKKAGHKSWRVWDSYTKVCFQLNDMSGALEGFLRLLDCRKANQIPIWMLHRLMMAAVTSDKTALSKDYFLARVLQAFKDYHNQLNMPLPSQALTRNEQVDVFTEEPVRVRLDRYRIWCLLTEAVGMVTDCWEIALKGARHFRRVLEDCFAAECPLKLREDQTYLQFADTLVATWTRCVNELHHFCNKLRTNNEAPNALAFWEQQRAESQRFVEDTNKATRVWIGNCTFLTPSERDTLLSRFNEAFP